MSFVNPQVLWMMGIPLSIFTYFILTHKDKFLQVFDKKVLARLTAGDDSLPLVIRNLILIMALFFMVVALARPVIDHGDKVVHLEGLSVVVALDISGSMRSKDVYPNRLEFAKKKINQLLDNMPNDDVSLIAFAYSSFMLAPFTSDKETLKLLVDGVNDQYINMGSTDFTALAEFTAELLEKKKPKILIVFSDGGEKEQLVKFEKLIKKNNIALYVVLVGTKEGAPVLRKNGKTIMKNGKMVISQRNDELGEIAVQNNGAFIVANSGESDIEELVSTIKAQHQSRDKGEVVIHDREELFYFPLGLGVLFLLLGFISLPRRG
jgi:Ca-activated chloride channel family protein